MKSTGSRSPDAASVVYVLPYKMGGVFNFVDNLLTHRRRDALEYYAVLDNNRMSRDTRPQQLLAADRQVVFDYSLPPENLRAVLSRLAETIPPGPGVLVANDWLSLAMSSVHDSGRTIINITHGDFDYYYQLAVMHESIIDCFLTYTDRMRDRLIRLLPHRTESIVKIPYGVVIPSSARKPGVGPLRLLYVGRIESGKGVFDLPLIDERLKNAGLDVTWTIQGEGPDRDRLQQGWSDPDRIRWGGMQPMSEVLALYQTHDVIVMPSRHEGLPVALLEAAVSGVVPVVSDLPSGIPEVVQSGETGFRVAVGDFTGFADAIATLARDRELLERMSGEVRAHAAARFDITERAADYQALFARWRDLRGRRPVRQTLHYGSRLDKPWIPNSVVKFLRGRQ